MPFTLDAERQDPGTPLVNGHQGPLTTGLLGYQESSSPASWPPIAENNSVRGGYSWGCDASVELSSVCLEKGRVGTDLISLQVYGQA